MPNKPKLDGANLCEVTANGDFHSLVMGHDPLQQVDKGDIDSFQTLRPNDGADRAAHAIEHATPQAPQNCCRHVHPNRILASVRGAQIARPA